MSTTIPLNPRRGEVWDVKFDPTVGTEIRKIRPAVVLNINSIRHLKIRLVAPITSWKAGFSGKVWYVKVNPDNANGLTGESAVDTLQMRGMDIQRFVEKRGRLSATLMDEIGITVASIIDYK